MKGLGLGVVFLAISALVLIMVSGTLDAAVEGPEMGLAPELLKTGNLPSDLPGQIAAAEPPAQDADYELAWPQIMAPELNEGLDFQRKGIFWLDLPEDEKIDLLMENLSDEEVLSQVFLLGWDNELPNGVIVDWIRQRNLGGVKVFGWNAQSVERLAQTLGAFQRMALDRSSGIPLFTATDQEGGWVRHVKDSTSMTPGNMALGAAGLPADSFLTGYFISRELRAIGINMNFAPTVDVYRNPLAHVIGPRAFSSDPSRTAQLGLAYFKGADFVRVISTAKHFPGHGNATGDSHGELPVVQDSLEDLMNVDLVPYRVLIDQGLPAVLTGHLSFPQVTGNHRPASLSSTMKTEILRKDMEFEGLTITDDLYMEGAWEYGLEEGWGISEIALEALRAGSDLVMLSRTPAVNDQVWELSFQEYQNNEDFRSRINDSVRRILRWKIRYLYPDDRVPLIPDPARTREMVPYPGAREFFLEQAARSVHVVEDRNMPILHDPELRTILIGQDADFFSVARTFFPGAAEYQFSYNPPYSASSQVIADVRRLAQSYERIIYNLANQNSGIVLENLSDIPGIPEKLFVLSILSPVYLERTHWLGNALAVYGWGRDSIAAGFAVMTGEIPATAGNPIPELLSEPFGETPASP